ncbi:hypothetical protein [Candidatus Methylobacter oryzae]|uniref:Flagellar protein FliT n=1 Tax=Candidatus Methylobacter oryzae TaxID=2497749 RepID=A0ABY3C9H0_9GAMM|nr:hypothetical protein [Candidatus Methylobacter oryzae]TRW93004.1 hypothetical protein EKO24_013795 [Candidatus Methylobacter oryzae]
MDQYPQFQLQELKVLFDEIQQHIAQEQWEQLTVVLELRQQYLEKMFSEATEDTVLLKSLANAIIEQDAIFVEKIKEQQKIVEKQILELNKGRQAVQAYGS